MAQLQYWNGTEFVILNSAAQLEYDNSQSTLESETVQTAIDELDADSRFMTDAERDKLAGIEPGATNLSSLFAIKQEKFIATEGQTVFTLNNGSYRPLTNRISWYWNRVKQMNDTMIESSPTTITFPANTFSLGDEVLFEYYEF